MANFICALINGFNLGILSVLVLWRLWGRDSFLRSYEKYREKHGPYPHYKIVTDNANGRGDE